MWKVGVAVLASVLAISGGIAFWQHKKQSV